jgi:phage gp46-like protein
MDVELLHTDDGGEITAENGIVKMADGLETCVYLALFGGAEDDAGGSATKSKQWWANLSENDPARKYRSETQYLLRALPLVPANLRRLELAAGRDLAWLVTEGLATEVEAVASMPALNKVQIEVTLKSNLGDKKYGFLFASRLGQAS